MTLRALAVAAVVGVVAGLLFVVVGVQTEFAWAWAVLVGAITMLFGLQMPEDPRVDAPGRPPASEHIGSEVSRLAWAISGRTGTVNEAVTRRVRATLRRRLQRRGIDVDDDRQSDLVEDLLGHGLWARLNGRRTTVGDLRDALAASERLAGSTRGQPVQEENG
ncbi:hypothetical protein [Microbacterium soli]|uniref:Uncharacterized protein n=1 Tax=Microbacterium soli TaxID=446075 RepID=A0ABP7NHT0_9MICO